MKKLILSIIFSFIVTFTPKAYASITFSPVSPQLPTIDISVSCDTGKTLFVYSPDGTRQVGTACNSSGDLFSSWLTVPSTPQTWDFVECDSSIDLTACGNFENATLTLALSNIAFSSHSTFSWASPSYSFVPVPMPEFLQGVNYLYSHFMINVLTSPFFAIILVGLFIHLIRRHFI